MNACIQIIYCANKIGGSWTSVIDIDWVFTALFPFVDNGPVNELPVSSMA